MVLALWGIGISSCSSDDNEDKVFSTSLTSSNLTGDGYYDGLLYYKITSNSPHEVGVSKANKNAQTVKIPSSIIIDGVTYKCTSIFSRAFESCNDLVEISMPDDIVSIGNSAFSRCGRLINISLSNNITTIQSYLFSGCISLTSFTIPPKVTSIEERAFNGCTSLSSVNLSDNVNWIGESAFEGCSSLTALNIPSYWAIVCDRAFKNCTSLKTVDINAVCIGVESFYGCSSLRTIKFDINLIGEKSLYNCNNLESIYLVGLTPRVFSFLSLSTETGDTYYFGQEQYLRNRVSGSDGVLTIGSSPHSISYTKHSIIYENYDIVNDDMYEMVTLYVTTSFHSNLTWSNFINIVVE